MANEHISFLLHEEDSKANRELAELLAKLDTGEQEQPDQRIDADLAEATTTESKAQQIEFVNRLTGRDGHAHNN